MSNIIESKFKNSRSNRRFCSLRCSCALLLVFQMEPSASYKELTMNLYNTAFIFIIIELSHVWSSSRSFSCCSER
ncbi:hypothetical protein DERF_012293 [Dermatophagoides farinae]|uniref:Uncharacterized protein n=1 Tax=Dermatophagoides farinae TaxID=6954 RepID=A0A922HTS5_DERFA|nr:hypothetical protein DERF_012293 [Dermatophagoides farinae]